MLFKKGKNYIISSVAIMIVNDRLFIKFIKSSYCVFCVEYLAKLSKVMEIGLSGEQDGGV